MATLIEPKKKRTRARSRAVAKRGMEPEDLLRFHLVADPQISPDERHVVLVKKHIGEKNKYVSNLWMVTHDGRGSWSKPRQFTNGSKDSHPRWSPLGDRIALIGERKKGHPQIYQIRAEGRTWSAFWARVISSSHRTSIGPATVGTGRRCFGSGVR